MRDLIRELDHSMPAAAHAALGTTLQALIANHNTLLAKFDAAGAAANIAAVNTAFGTSNVVSLSIPDLKTLGLTAT